MANRLSHSTNALVLVVKGMSYVAVAKVWLLDDDTVRNLRLLYEEEVDGRASFRDEGSVCRLNDEPSRPDQLDHQDPAALDARDWHLDRDGISHRTAERLRADRAPVPIGHGASQAESDIAQARS